MLIPHWSLNLCSKVSIYTQKSSLNSFKFKCLSTEEKLLLYVVEPGLFQKIFTKTRGNVSRAPVFFSAAYWWIDFSPRGPETLPQVWLWKKGTLISEKHWWECKLKSLLFALRIQGNKHRFRNKKNQVQSPLPHVLTSDHWQLADFSEPFLLSDKKNNSVFFIEWWWELSCLCGGKSPGTGQVLNKYIIIPFQISCLSLWNTGICFWFVSAKS